MFDSHLLRSKARDLAVEARQAGSDEDKLSLTSKAKTYLLLAKNAEWLESTGNFLKAVQAGERWPHPSAAVEQSTANTGP